jgi:hypothetical protein
MSIPLQTGFDCDSKACLPVGIDYLTASAFEQRIVGTVSLSQSTAVATPFGRMPTIHDIQLDIVVKTPLLKNLLELEKRNTHNSSIESPAPRIESSELFDCDVGIEPVGNLDYFPDYLTEIRPHEIEFPMSGSFELLDGVDGLKECSSFHQFFASLPDVFSKISLIEDFTFWRQDADSKMFGIDIYTKDVLPSFDFFFLGEICDYTQVFGQTECLTDPVLFDERIEPLIISVLLDGDCNAFSRICSELYEKVGCRAERLTISGDIELHSNGFDCLTFFSPSVPYERTSDLYIEGGAIFAN